ncbi:TIGR03087 family PEP-CTERM/XrtA system glycosyltransferase [Sphingomonas montana]|uniref:TIGR03087 family PEP-CTERM/XrtA system glycosyltransferase n=1 Tax=Sphingomonas montana TaxID=1843236 RepID=UPI00096D37E4|nr:TIGR03087 family PEP-CTERM/XrtA system glycosyltransferase [Sphingomonas montana]
MSRDILFLCHRVPFPPDRGDKIRSFNILKALAALGRVHLLTFADDAADAAHADGLAPWVASSTVVVRRRGRAFAALSALASRRPVSLAMFDDPAMRRAAHGLFGRIRFDTVYAFSGQMAQFVPDDVHARFLMDFVDVDSAKFAGYAATAGPFWRHVNAREGRLLAAYEAAVADRADLSLFVSRAEAALFASRHPAAAARVMALENGIDLATFRPDADVVPVASDGGPLILFTGQMDYAPNVEAVDGFARAVLPTIRAGFPTARFVIVGRAPVPAVRALAALPGVEVTGAVADVRPWLAAAEVVVAPLKLARGIQNKVLEAMAMGKAVVASPAAHEGIDADPGRHLIVAGPDRQADAVRALIADPVRRASLGRAARARMVERYGWDRVLAPLAAMVGGTEDASAIAAE